ncbi:PSP1 C-terminal conserved region-domain-containing protein [Fennellomyces sp. T-0311]|nr:PSP1 C-terminal conserved region-domain-containing protein [Fennellomyces sp. T-0311]
MLEQQPPVFVNPWDNQPFRFPPTSSSMETNTSPTAYQQQHQHQPQPTSSPPGYEPFNDDEEPTLGDTPYWLGGPLDEEPLEPSPTPKSSVTMPMFKEDQEHKKREGELMLERERMMNSQVESVLPYRRHSLAHEPLIQQRKSSFFPTLPVPGEKRASFSAASPSSFMMGQTPWVSQTSHHQQTGDRFGMNIWSNKLKASQQQQQQQQQQHQQQSLLWEYGGIAGNLKSGSSATNYSPSPTASSSTSSQSLFPSSYTHLSSFIGERGQPLRTGRRLSLSPLPTTSEDTIQEHFNPRDMLTSVPEEPGFLPYRRHSLAGPLLGVATPRNTTASYLDEQRQQQRQLDKFLPSNLLSSDLLESVEQHDLPSVMSWCMVEFKAGRSEIYYCSIPVEKDDWVIVEADRGRDLGKVVAKDLPADQVALLLQSTNSGMWEEPAPTTRSSGTTSPTAPTTSSPKRICRLATTAEITLLVTKRQDEQKALLICQTKSKQKKLMMDIVDAEYQWDRRKLTFYFVAERRVDFRELVRDLFKIYKTRIWMCSVNTVGKKPPM